MGPFTGNEVRTLVIIALSVTLLVACATNYAEQEKGWPPVSNDIRNEFDSNHSSLEALSLELTRSIYSSVFRWDNGEVAAYKMDSEDHEMINLEDPKRWIELFEDANVDTVDRYRGKVSLSRRFEPTNIVDGRVFDHTFVKSDAPESTNCLPHYAESECGACVENLDDKWHVTLMWYPNDFLSGFDDLDESDTEEFDELNTQMQIKMGLCMNRFIEGASSESEFVPTE